MLRGSMVALVTPMGDDGSIDFGALDELIEFHVDEGTDGLVIAGTTGESATLSQQEHIKLLEHAIRHVRGRIPVIAGTGSNSTAQTVELTKAVSELSPNAYLIVTPYYNKPTQEGLYRHFCACAEAVEEPIILYNVPGRTGCDMLPETVIRLAKIDGIAGIKEATGDIDRATQILEHCGDEFGVYSGDDPTALDLMLAGGHGVISVTANVVPKAMSELCELAKDGKEDEARALDDKLMPVHKALFLESNPIPVKWAVHRMGMIGAGIRLPLTPMVRDHELDLCRALEGAGVKLL